MESPAFQSAAALHVPMDTYEPEGESDIIKPTQTSTGPGREPSNNEQPHQLRSPETLGILVEVRKSEGKGYGLFAQCDILPGTILLSETPLVTLIDTGTRIDPLDIAVGDLPPTERRAYQLLHIFKQNPSESHNRSVLYSNGFAIGDSSLATGVFEIASRINHSCVPNSDYQWQEGAERMVFVNRFKLLEGEEVTIDYGHRKKQLAKYYGFECNCGGCTDSGSSLGSSRSSECDPQEEMPNIDAVIQDSLGQ